MRLFLFLLTFVATGFLYPSRVVSQHTYFEFSPVSKVTSLEGEVTILVEYELVNLQEDQFKIRPVSEKGTAQIWDGTNNNWISERELWSSLPMLGERVRIRFLSGKFYDTALYFQIQDTQTAQIYETPKHRVWGRSWFIDYIQKLNENILRVVE